MHWPRVFALAVVVPLGLSAAAWARNQQETETMAEKTQAVWLVRAINTAEMRYAYDRQGRYGTWQQLWDSGSLKPKSAPNGKLSRSPEPIPGYHLEVLVSSDGKSYTISLHDMRKGKGLFSVFSDQSGIIFVGAPLQ